MDPELDPQLLADACGEDPSWVCRQVFDWTDGNEFLTRTVDFLLARPLQILLILVGAWLVTRLLRRAISRFVSEVTDSDSMIARFAYDDSARLRATARAHTIGQVLRSITSVTVYGIAALMVLSELGVNLGPLLAGAGIAGIAIGFGAQSLVKDFLSGIFMLVEDQYGVGDIVDVGETVGTVEQVTLRSTRIRDLDGAVWHVPNGLIARVANHSQQYGQARLEIGVAYGTDIEHAKSVIKRTADELWQDEGPNGRILAEPEIWGVESFGPNGIVIRLVVKTKPSEQWGVNRELRARLKAAFDAEGIEPPFPRQIWLPGDRPRSPDDDRRP
jgi:small conductance mechanosensitive channel